LPTTTKVYVDDSTLTVLCSRVGPTQAYTTCYTLACFIIYDTKSLFNLDQNDTESKVDADADFRVSRRVKYLYRVVDVVPDGF